MAIKGTPSMRSAVQSLQQILNADNVKADSSPDVVRRQAQAAQFPYPELAAQVFKFLQTKPRVNTGLTTEDISDAFMALLMDSDSLEALGGGKKNNPWLNVRAILRKTGNNMGTSLLDVYNTVRKTGLGYKPTILQLSAQLSALFAAFDASGKTGINELKLLAKESFDLTPWQMALAAAFMRRRKGNKMVSDADLEELFADPDVLKELMNVDGPWEVYLAHGQTLRILRNFGQSLLDLADAVEAT